MTDKNLLNTQDFEREVLHSDLPVLVDFFADWCGPCKAMMPLIAEIEKEEAHRVKVFRVDVDSEKELSRRYGIMSIPTLILFRKGEQVSTLVGVHAKEEILEMLQ